MRALVKGVIAAVGVFTCHQGLAEPWLVRLTYIPGQDSRISANFSKDSFQETTVCIAEFGNVPHNIAKDIVVTIMADKDLADRARSYEFRAEKPFVIWTPTSEDSDYYVARLRFRGKKDVEAMKEIAQLAKVRDVQMTLRYANAAEIGSAAVVSEHKGHSGRGRLVVAGESVETDFGISSVRTYGRVKVTVSKGDKSATVDNNVNDMGKVLNDAKQVSVRSR